MAKEPVELKVPVSELEIGMQVVRLDRPWLETSFLLQGFVIRSAEEIQALQAQCEYVFVDGLADAAASDRSAPSASAPGKPKPNLDRGKPTRTKSPTSLKPKSPPVNRIRYEKQCSVEAELPAAIEAYEQARELAHHLMDDLRVGGMLDMNQVRQVVSQCVDSVLRNQDALLWLTQIKQKDAYTAEHCMNVAILTAAFAKHLGLPESEIEAVALAGLLHDVGKAKVPLEILNKPGPLTPEEFQEVKLHPVYGRELLLETGRWMPTVLESAYFHHERPSGGGYPEGLSQQDIPYSARIVAITDAYDAMTSNRCYASGRSSREALDIIYKGRGTQFDEELAQEFIQCIGIYPPGAIVELSSGEVGIVMGSSDQSKLRPRILLLRDDAKQPRPERVVDLMHLDLDPSGQKYQIVREWPNGSFGIELKDYLDKWLSLTAEIPEAKSG